VDTGGKTSSYLHRDILVLIERQAERLGDSIAFEDSEDLALFYRDVAAKIRGFRAISSKVNSLCDSEIAANQ